MRNLLVLLTALGAVVHSSQSIADHATEAESLKIRADSHAPIGVMADHMHKAGEWMLSYRFMTMNMQDNLKNSSSIDPDTIATTEPNRFSGMPGMPPTLRIVPLEMTMDMHMLGLMYAPTDNLTLMLMANYVSNSMRHVTYAGGIGTDELGNFKTATRGWSDTSLSGLLHLLDRNGNKLHAIIGVSLPTGSTEESDRILAPTGMTPVVRVPYPMQLGSGSYDPILGINYSGSRERLGWGAQWRGEFRTSRNDDDYELGDEHRLNVWLSYLFRPAISGSIRFEYFRRDNISGQDPMIMGPVQTADPDRQAARRSDVALGINYAASGSMQGWRLALEYVLAVDQKLDGPQLETDDQLIIGLQKAF